MRSRTDHSTIGRSRQRWGSGSRCGGSKLRGACLLAILASCLAPTRAHPQVVDPNLWGMGLANVLAVARSGNTLYVGGVFSRVGPNTGSGIPLCYGRGDAAPHYARVNGEILAAISDGAGGWFIGGSFTAVGGRPRRHLARILAGGEVAEWSPDPNQQVHALALSGGTLYVGGQFDSIAGQPRSLIAAVDLATGQVTSWNPSATDVLYNYPVVSTLAVRGDTVYAGGNFLSIGGVLREYLAAVDARTGETLAWDPNPDQPVKAITLDGNVAYVGGPFWYLGGQRRYLAGAVDLATGAATSWDPRITDRRRQYYEPVPEVLDFLVRDGTVFIAGFWDSLGGQYRSGLGAVDAATGALTAWAPQPGGGFPYSYVRALDARSDTIYAGGYFSTLQGVPRICLAAVDATTGIPTPWDPRPNDEVNALVVDDDFIYAAGYYHTLGPWQVRYNLAAFDLTTGLPTDWNPDPDGVYVSSLAVKDGIVYTGGHFAHVGGQARSGIAALDAVSGSATGWNPSSDGAVNAMVLRGDTLYVGGGFTNIGGQPRRYLAALDASTGLASGWDPNPADVVTGLVLQDNTMFASGGFARMGPERRAGLAAVDATTGALRPWKADANGWVYGLTMSGGRLYVAGVFDSIAGEPRRSLAAIDAVSGSLTMWDPNPSGQVGTVSHYGPPRLYAVAALGHEVYVGGNFSDIGGRPRVGLAAVDDSLGRATDWNPQANEVVWSLRTIDSELYVGGKFRTIGGLPAASLARVSFPQPPGPPLPALALAQSAPNPARTTAIIRFTLPAPGPVRLEVFDVRGRRVATLVDRQTHTAGEHHVLIRADQWGPGAYFYRLEAAGRSVTRKMIVL